jgi:riboflavin biosynthesis pyrimidine reductase
MVFRELFPQSENIEIEDYVRSFDLAGRAPEDRPYVVANFVSSLDGRGSAQGLSGPLGDDGDKAVFRTLRGAADAVLVGTRTLQAERYGRLIRAPEVRDRRRAEGLRPDPLACILTRSGRLPLEIPLFAAPEAEVVVFTADEAELADMAGVPVALGDLAAHVAVVRLPPAELDFAHALAHVRAEHEVRVLLCEGGPSVLSALVRERVLDELFLTLAPKLLGGGEETAITSGRELPELAPVRLAGVLERAGSLFLRYQHTNQVQRAS